MLVRALARLTLPALFAAVAQAGDLWIVDESGGGDFTSIGAAVAASADGDTIVVVGVYAKLDKFVINGKGVSLVHEDGSLLNLNWISIRNLPEGSEVLLANITPHYKCFIDLSSNDGRVVLDGVRSGQLGFELAIEVYDCADVVLNDCRLRGFDGYDELCDEEFADGSSALAASEDSRVAVYGSTLRGGDGGYNSCMGYSGYGGAAIEAHDQARVFTSGCTLEGGVHDLGGHQDAVILTGQAVHTEYTGPPNLFIGPWLEKQGQTTNLRVAGPAGDRAFLLLGTSGWRRPFNAFQGILHVRPAATVPMGTIPANGLLSFPFPQPALPPGSEAELLQAQVVLSPPATVGAGVSAARRFFLTNPKGWIVRN